MMEFFKVKNTIDFMARRKLLVLVSLALVIISLVSVFTRGLNLGVDFTGGTLVEVGYAQSADLQSVRGALAKGGFEGAVVQHFGTSQDVLIRLAPSATAVAEIGDKVLAALNADGHKVELRRIEFVGPQVGDELANDGGLAVLAALFGILIYVYFRYEIRFAVGAVLATLHDVIIMVGVFSIFWIEFDLTVLAAVLAIIGYSINDTVVVYDRIRETFRKVRKGTAAEIINQSVTQTLSRTIMTSGTTMLVVVSLFLFGGTTLHGFSLALIIGIAVGTYSSIFIASSLVILMGVSKTDLVVVEKEGAEVDSTP
jgi:preprotein translocase subunit SecF